MNKLIIRGILISGAAGLVLLIMFRSTLPFGGSNSSFSIEEGKDISKIEFSDEGRKLTLEKADGTWLINGKPETRKSGILFIIRILREINIKSPVSPSLFESEITANGIKPVTVKVYGNRKLIKRFLVYKTASNNYGNIMKLKESSKPFIVYLPGYEGDIGSGFTLNELFWKPFTVFNLLPSEISDIKLENLADTSSSFSISNDNQHFTLSSFERKLTGWDTALVTRYISYFAWIPFEKWASGIAGEEKKRIESQQPLFRITVITTDGKKSVLTLWEKLKGEDGATSLDSDRLLGKTETSNEFFVMRYFDIDPLLKRRSYFFPE